MAAAYTTAVRYSADAQCVTPLRTCGAEGGAEDVLRDSRGNAFVQGSSLAGALRGWLEKTEGEELAEKLFGSTAREGHLMVSDAVLRAGSRQTVRPRLRLDERRGAADGWFGMAHMEPGSRLSFTLTWLGDGRDTAELAAVEGMLGALHRGEIRLGAQKGVGFGRLSLCVRRRRYELTKAEDRAAWLADSDDGEELALPGGEMTRQVTFTVEGYADPVLIKASARVYEGGQGCYVNIEEGGRPILPGSSVKGALRAQCMRIVRSAGVEAPLTEELFGRKARRGDSGQAGMIRVDDVCVERPQKQRASRIRIDRFTGGVIRKGLFTEEPLSGKVCMSISVQTERKAECALLLYALRDMGLGLYGLGSGSSVGRGYIKVDRILIEAPGERRAAVLFEGDAIMARDPDGLLDEWQSAWKECLKWN